MIVFFTSISKPVSKIVLQLLPDMTQRRRGYWGSLREVLLDDVSRHSVPHNFISILLSLTPLSI
jgi:hypothetical protein